MTTDYNKLYNNINTSLYNLNINLITDICNELNHSDKIQYFVNKYLKEIPNKKINKSTTNDNIKKNKSAYMFFTEEIRPKLQKKFPQDKLGQISKRLGKLWSNLKSSDKKKYEKKALQDKKRYMQELTNTQQNTTTINNLNTNNLIENSLHHVNTDKNKNNSNSDIESDAKSISEYSSRIITNLNSSSQSNSDTRTIEDSDDRSIEDSDDRSIEDSDDSDDKSIEDSDDSGS